MIMQSYVKLMDIGVAKQRMREIILNLRGVQSQREFARKLGVTYGAVQGWEQADTLPSWEAAEAIAGMLGMTLPQFIAYWLDMPASLGDVKPQFAEDVLEKSKQLNGKERGRLAKLLIDSLTDELQ